MNYRVCCQNNSRRIISHPSISTSTYHIKNLWNTTNSILCESICCQKKPNCHPRTQISFDDVKFKCLRQKLELKQFSNHPNDPSLAGSLGALWSIRSFGMHWDARCISPGHVVYISRRVLKVLNSVSKHQFVVIVGTNNKINVKTHFSVAHLLKLELNTNCSSN